MEWLNKLETPIPNGAITWLVIAILAVILLLLLLALYRRLTGGLFIAGGRSRKARLSVMDAAPVDSHRRLVLVRRDDVEHLVMIGGPSDIVVEQSIRIGAPVHKPRSIMDEAEPARPMVVAGGDMAADLPDYGDVPVERRRIPQPAASPAMAVTPPAAAASQASASVTPLKPAPKIEPAPMPAPPANGNGETKPAVAPIPAAVVKPAPAPEPAAPASATAPAKPAEPAKPEPAKDAAPVRKTIFGTPVPDKPKAPAPAAAAPAPVAPKPAAAAAAPAAAPKADNADVKKDQPPAAASGTAAEKTTAAKTDKDDDSKPTDELELEMERLLSELTGTSG